MKKAIITLTLAILTSALALASTPDSMYVHFTGANGDSIVVHAIAHVDSIVYYAPEVPPATSGTFTDSRDNNTYNWVTIGEQVWMAENLAYLPRVHSNALFANADSACYGVYGYDGTDVTAAKDSANYSTYGVLYNWYAAMAGASSSDASPSGVQGVCPTGWHLPSDDEWTILT
ncbi:MAG: FISUMP domain-containing protein, partial [Bacteroidales bacterium]|nr:FISUMP domain-containing protein [Bacteroidales bacterium]